MKMSDKVTDHFTLRELTKSSNAARRGISNVPDNDQLNNMIILCVGILEPVRKHFGRPYNPGSVFRNQEVNALAGSSSTSQHTKGQAADIEIPGIDNFELASYIVDNLLFDQLILEHYESGDTNSGWVHVSLKQTDNREEVLTFDGKRYLPGLRK